MRTALALSVPFVLAAAVALGACGGSAPPPANATNSSSWVAKTEQAPATRPEPPPTSSLSRSAVRAVLHEGLGRFLQRVDLDVDHPVMRDGKFHGYRIMGFKGDPSFWQGVDLKPGDVVVRVNGFSVGNENEAHDAFTSLDVASELDVLYERDGAPHEMRYAIVDDPQ